MNDYVVLRTLGFSQYMCPTPGNLRRSSGLRTVPIHPILMRFYLSNTRNNATLYSFVSLVSSWCKSLLTNSKPIVVRDETKTKLLTPRDELFSLYSHFHEFLEILYIYLGATNSAYFSWLHSHISLFITFCLNFFYVKRTNVLHWRVVDECKWLQRTKPEIVARHHLFFAEYFDCCFAQRVDAHARE